MRIHGKRYLTMVRHDFSIDIFSKAISVRSDKCEILLKNYEIGLMEKAIKLYIEEKRKEIAKKKAKKKRAKKK